MKKEEKIVSETIKRLEAMSENNSTFAPPLLGLLKSMNPEMRSFYVKMAADALKAADVLSGATADPDFVKYATNKKKNG